MTSFTPVSATIGGLLIGGAAAALWLLVGKIAGVSGVLGGALSRPGDRAWRLAFLAGLVLGGLVGALALPGQVAPSPRGRGLLALAGLLVGVGTTLGNGCTSGHGVCGIGRLSPRSIAATCVFVGTGMATVAVLRLAGVG